ncbi:hypothetical protein GCM10009661_49800 [Catellatospora chokoriensis]|uniref:Uncharacterized protein n=1 Tax=Catellatospora chokoriensis TaxID=310353 RepID=A0A8J3K847_9ACTN|nr:hypothetical protein Cch02nite_80710 [Catellatospora chokoriensis]
MVPSADAGQRSEVRHRRSVVAGNGPDTDIVLAAATATSVVIEVDKAVADAAADARAVLLAHRAVPGGMCRGCHEFRRAFAWFPCPQAVWAQRVLRPAGGVAR